MAERQKVVLLTGGSDGLGLLAAKKFLLLGWRVIITGRQKEKTENAVLDAKKVTGKEDISYILLDLASLDSIRNAANQFLGLNLPLDVLFNNAGYVPTERHVDPTGTFELSIFANFVGPFYLTELLLDKVKSTPHSRILIVSSGVHNPERQSAAGGRPAILDFNELDGKNFEPMYSYKISKLANLYHTYILASQLVGVTVNSLTPGFVPATALSRDHPAIKSLPGGRSIETATDEYVYYATSPELNGVTGEYFVEGKIGQSSAASHDLEQGKKLWNLACEVTGLRNRILA